MDTPAPPERPIDPEDTKLRSEAEGARPSQSLPAAVEALLDTVTELVQLRLARLSLGLRRGALWVLASLVAALAAGTWIAGCVWFLVSSLVTGGRTLVPEAPWLGASLVAGLGIAALGAVLYGAFVALGRAALRKLGDLGLEGSSLSTEQEAAS